MNDNDSTRQERDAQREQQWAEIGKRLLVDELQSTANEPFDAMHTAAQAIRDGDLDEGDLQACQIALYEAIEVVDQLAEVIEDADVIEKVPE